MTAARPLDGPSSASADSVQGPSLDFGRGPRVTLVNVTRYPGKPTSGRSVYRDPIEQGWSWPWHWQCDLHGDDDRDDQWGTTPTWKSAMRAALWHAESCPYVSASVR